MNQLDRLKEAIKTLKENQIIKDQGQIATDLGYNRQQSISDIVTGRANMSSKFVKAFCNKYGYSEEWLLTGQGEMLSNSGRVEDEEDLGVKLSEDKQIITFGKHVYRRLRPDEYNEAFKDWPGVPMYNVPVTASFVATYRDHAVFTPQYYLHDPRFKDCNFGAIITGDSMHSEIRHGDFVVCQEVVDKEFVVFGDIYYVVAANGLETCKYLNADPKNENNFLLVPKNDKISPSPIPKKMIQKLYRVRGVLRGY